MTEDQINEIREIMARRGMGFHMIDGINARRAWESRLRRESRWKWLLERLGW